MIRMLALVTQAHTSEKRVSMVMGSTGAEEDLTHRHTHTQTLAGTHQGTCQV